MEGAQYSTSVNHGVVHLLISDMNYTIMFCCNVTVTNDRQVIQLRNMIRKEVDHQTRVSMFLVTLFFSETNEIFLRNKIMCTSERLYYHKLLYTHN